MAQPSCFAMGDALSGVCFQIEKATRLELVNLLVLAEDLVLQVDQPLRQAAALLLQRLHGAGLCQHSSDCSANYKAPFAQCRHVARTSLSAPHAQELLQNPMILFAAHCCQLPSAHTPGRGCSAPAHRPPAGRLRAGAAPAGVPRPLPPLRWWSHGPACSLAQPARYAGAPAPLPCGLRAHPGRPLPFLAPAQASARTQLYCSRCCVQAGCCVYIACACCLCNRALVAQDGIHVGSMWGWMVSLPDGAS